MSLAGQTLNIQRFKQKSNKEKKQQKKNKQMFDEDGRKEKTVINAKIPTHTTKEKKQERKKEKRKKRRKKETKMLVSKWRTRIKDIGSFQNDSNRKQMVKIFSFILKNLFLLVLIFRKVPVFFYCLISIASGLSPYFVSPAGNTDVVTIVENISPGTPIYLLKIMDPDPGDILSLQVMGTPDFTVIATRTPGEFTLSPNRLFNYSVPADRFHNFSIAASDSGATVSVYLSIRVIPSRSYVGTIDGNFTALLPEEVPIGTRVHFGNLNLQNSFGGNFSVYSLTGKDASDFRINQLSGEIRVARRIDRDRGLYRTTDLHLTVTNQTGYTATASLVVLFQDINDNAPVCSPSVYYFDVRENGTAGVSIGNVSCQDKDSGSNKLIGFQFEPTNINNKYFSIDQKGEIRTTSEALDYEGLSGSNFQLELIVLASDQSKKDPPKTGTATVIVMVQPVNEFSPEWGQFSPPLTSVKNYDVKENSPVGTVIVTVKAVDLDLGADGEITYEMNTTGPESAFFRLDTVTGELTVKSLIDADPKTGGTDFFHIQMLAKDGGGKETTRITLWLMMDDDNDNSPQFGSSIYTAFLAENATVGTSVAFLDAKDDDLFASLSFSIVSGDPTGKFGFSPSNGSLLQLNAVIQPDKPRNDAALYHLKVQVKDGGQPEQTAETDVVIHVQLINDHAPQFGTTTTASVDEDAPVGTTVVKVTATDDDWGDDKNIVYLIPGGNTNGAFSIDRKEGVIRVARPLDFEAVSVYRLNILASDEGNPPKSGSLQQEIKIVNVNDLPVTCSDNYIHIKIPENITINSEVANISCFDQDNLTSVTHKINGAGLGLFQIDNTGHLVVTSALDYDKGAKSYSFDVSVFDGIFTTTIPVMVNLLPVNEFSPHFLQTNLTKRLSEDAAIDSLVTTVWVSDEDAPPHQLNRVWIDNVLSPAVFHLDEDTGNIRLVRQLDYETKTSYTLFVVAVDGGNLRATCTVSVLVEDVNDNAPVCDKSIQHVALKEDQATGTLVSSLKCRDADSGAFGNLSYSLKQIPFGHDFIVNASGQVILQGSGLDYESTKSYQLKVVVEDRGFKQTSVLIMIDILDVNDGPPHFLNSSRNVSIPENKPLMSRVTSVVAIDPDDKQGPYGHLVYRIISGNNEQSFAIDSNTGEIFLAGNLDRERTPIYVLTVEARESIATNAASASTTLTVSVMDVNDNPPVCSFSSFYREIKETTLPGNTSQILSLSCSDLDSPDVGGSLSYSLTNGDKSVFALMNNDLVLKGPLDFDQGKRRYFLTLTVSDSLHKIDILGSIVVISVDEYPPVFKPASYSKNVPENSLIGQIIVIVNAFDLDSVDTADGIVKYSLLGSSGLPFTVDPNTGHVSLSSILDWEAKQFYSFLVQANDKSHQTSAIVNITLVDVNDNSPVFEKGVYSQKVSETVSIGTTILQVSASDADGPSNGNITYSIIGGNEGNEFGIDPQTGHIKTLKILDYDSMSKTSFTLQIKAADQNGSPGSLSATTSATFSLLSVNEYPPVFTQTTYLVNVKESEAVGFQFLQVSSKDQDKGPDGEVFYSFESNFTRSFFVLDQLTGRLFLRRLLDFETTQRYSFNITATDQGEVPLSGKASVIVLVQNVNDEAPECPMSFLAKNIREDLPKDSFILKLDCHDKDTGTYGKLSFLIHEVNGQTGSGSGSGPRSGSFKIDNTGQLLLSSPLDYETEKSVQLKIKVQDGGNPPKSTEVLVKITVVDVNEAKPVFDSLPRLITIPESTPIGQVVLKVIAYDNDTSDLLTYFFTTPSDKFEINSVSGEIKTKSLLDFESKPSFTLNIAVSDSGSIPKSFSSQATLTVQLTDTNDSPPVFSSSVYRRSVRENQGPGSVVATLTVTDADSGSNAQSTFLIASGDTTNTFQVARDGAGNCEVTLGASHLDYEIKSQYSLVIRATDDGGLSAETTLVIQVDPYNEYAPSFQNVSSKISIKEDVSVGTTLVKIVATDGDAGRDGVVSYEISGGRDTFMIDRHQGVLTLRGQLDREQVERYNLLILAKDDGVIPSALTSTLTLTVEVKDVNDNDPSCEGREKHITSLSENQPVGTHVFRLFCKDQDNDPEFKNNVLRFSIVRGNTAGSFAINASTGHLTTTAVLDRETRPFYQLTIQVSDLGYPSRSVEQTIFVQITDLNDNSPVFTSGNYTISVSESLTTASIILKLTATDSDVGDAGLVFYSILSGDANNQFALDSLTGDLKLIKNLDRESISNYSLSVRAVDGGSPPLSAQTVVMVTVIDENDNSPSCSSSYYSVKLGEDAPLNTPVLSLICTDLDQGVNARLSYSIASGNAHSSFNIDPDSGNVTVYGSLDAERAANYLLKIDVSDQVHTTKVQLEVELVDINESPPKFIPPGPYGIHLLENTAIGSSVFQVTAKDEDASPPKIFFSFPTPNKYFDINKLTGVVSLNGRLDRETTSAHRLSITATDNGSPSPLSNSTVLTITVDDINDNPPFCKQVRYVVSLPENTLPSTLIANISCTDVDPSSPVVKYSIQGGNNSGTFDVDSGTGQIFLKKTLDFETDRAHVLNIEAEDNGQPLALVTGVILNVKVEPINEYPPVFSSTSKNLIQIPENSSLGSVVTWVNATDADEGEDHSELAFGIESGDASGQFLIDPRTGKLTLTKYLNRESKDHHTLTVIARDCIRGFGKPLTSSATIHIEVTDVNDNYPEFVQSTHVLTVSENVKVGTKLLSLEAHDDDVGTNGQVDFRIISGDDDNKFTINGKDLIVRDKLSFMKKKLYLLKVEAHDRGVPMLSSHAYVTIHVESKNNYPPTLEVGNASLVLKENHPIGSIVYRVNATDKDTGNSDGFNISIVSVLPLNAPREAFLVDSQKGEIVLAASLDYDRSPNKFSLIIVVADKESPNTKPLSSTMTLSVTIENVNDNSPAFSRNTYSFTVDENLPANTLIGQVEAIDKDYGLFGSVRYYVMDDGQDFGLNPDNGRLFVNASLNYELKSAYVFIVEAVDQGNPAKSGRCSVFINVQDINDNAPQFVLSAHSLEISENAALDTSVVRVEATDADSSANGNSDIEFSLSEESSAKHYFRIDAASGLVVLSRRLDRETMAAHDLIVYATDNGTPRMTGSTNITIHVKDVNDNSPKFFRHYYASVSEKRHIGSVVFRLTAYDPDEGKNGALTFDIISGNVNEDFRLDSGFLLINRSLDRERTNRYRIKLKASDGGTPRRTTTTDAVIFIKDENDNVPHFLSSNYSFSIAENLPSSTKVGRLVAMDSDVGRNALLKYKILYMLTGPNDFYIDGGNGMLTTRLKLDRESVPYYRLWCQVTDSGTPSLTGYTEVNILVSDENDHTPAFRRNEYSVSISEEDPIGTTIISFNITDQDEGNYSAVSLSILPNAGDAILAAHYLRVESANQSLVLKRRVDRELVSELHFTVLAQDGGIPRLSSKATVDILVGDFNDHDPLFTETFYDLEVAYDGSCTDFLTQVKAIDRDKDENGRVVYYFVENKFNYLFGINDFTGEVRIEMNARKNWKYVLTVHSHDFGNPQRRSANNATLRIDTFDPTEIIVSIRMGINQKEFQTEEHFFRQKMNALLRVKYPSGYFQIWCIEERDGEARTSVQAMRRLTSSNKPITVNVYCVKSNQTKIEDNVSKKKEFCTQKQLLSFLTVEATGEISAALKGPAWDYFAIEKAQGFGHDHPINWVSSREGIAIIVLSLLLIILAVAISTGYCYWRRKRHSSIDPKSSSIERKIASTDNDELKNKTFRPNVLTLPSLNSNIIPNNKEENFRKMKKNFNGRAIDPVSGRLYEFNSMTNESRWVPTPVEITSKMLQTNKKF